MTVKEDALIKSEEVGTSVSEKNKEQLIGDEVDESVEFNSIYDSCRNYQRINLSTLEKDVNLLSFVRVLKLYFESSDMNRIWNCRKSKNVVANKRTPKFIDILNIYNCQARIEDPKRVKRKGK